MGFSGYFGATGPLAPPLRPSPNRDRFDNADSSSRRRWVTFSAIAVSPRLANSCNLEMGIVLSALVVPALLTKHRLNRRRIGLALDANLDHYE